MKFSLGLISFVVIELFCATTLLAQDQTLIRHCFIPETSEHDTIKFGVMLPPSYESNSQSYPVVYYLHGLNGFYTDWKAQIVAEFYAGLSSDGEIPECILIFPDGEEGFWFDHYDRELLLEKDIVEFLIPHVDQNYPVDVSKRLIMGWSAGGAGAITIYSKNPELFKAAISLDGPIISWEEFLYFQGERPEIVNNSDYYYENASPFEWVVRNKNIIREEQDTAFFLAAALFAQSQQKFLSILQDQGIPFKYKELDCNHEFGCVFSEISSDLISYLSKTLD